MQDFVRQKQINNFFYKWTFGLQDLCTVTAGYRMFSYDQFIHNVEMSTSNKKCKMRPEIKTIKSSLCVVFVERQNTHINKPLQNRHHCMVSGCCCCFFIFSLFRLWTFLHFPHQINSNEFGEEPHVIEWWFEFRKKSRQTENRESHIEQ